MAAWKQRETGGQKERMMAWRRGRGIREVVVVGGGEFRRRIPQDSRWHWR